MRFGDPQAGAVSLDGHDVRDITLASLRENVGLLLQDTYLPDLSAREAIAQGREGATEPRGGGGRARCRRARRARRAAEGYDAPIGPGGRRLSGGQRRRLAIARAFVRDTPVLVLDEPTTGLDEGARDRLLEPLRALMAGRTTVVITHDPAVIAWADRVLELRDGALLDSACAAPGT